MIPQSEQILKVLYKYMECKPGLWSNVIGAGVKNITYGSGVIEEVELNEHGVYLLVNFVDNGTVMFNVDAFQEELLYDLEISERSFEAIIIDATKIKEELDKKEKRKREEDLYRINMAFKKYNIKSLWYMIHIDSLKSILSKGIYCRNLAESEGLEIIDISDEYVQSRREQFHQYVNLYMADNTPMLYVVARRYSDKIILLEIDPLKAIKNKFRFTDGNAASSDTSIYEDLDCLSRLDWSIIKARSIAYSRGYKRIRAAEVLIEKHVQSESVRCIHVQSTNCKIAAHSTLRQLGMENIMVKKDLTLNGIN